jgi:hypothetical protein
LPHDEGIYIFGSRGKNDITFFNGSDIISTHEKKLLVQLVEQQRPLLKSAGAEITDKFSLYLREMYDQTIASLTSPNRTELEQSVINLLKTIEQ